VREASPQRLLEVERQRLPVGHPGDDVPKVTVSPDEKSILEGIAETGSLEFDGMGTNRYSLEVSEEQSADLWQCLTEALQTKAFGPTDRLTEAGRAQALTDKLTF